MCQSLIGLVNQTNWTQDPIKLWRLLLCCVLRCCLHFIIFLGYYYQRTWYDWAVFGTLSNLLKTAWFLLLIIWVNGVTQKLYAPSLWILRITWFRHACLISITSYCSCAWSAQCFRYCGSLYGYTPWWQRCVAGWPMKSIEKLIVV